MARSLAARKRLAALGEAHMNLMVNPECPDAQRQAKRFARPPMTETQLVAAARDFLNSRGIPNIRVHSGGAHGAGGGWMNFKNSGAPDIIAILPPAGRTLCLELKVGRNKPTALQERWLARAGEEGAAVLVAWGINEVVQEVERLLAIEKMRATP